MCHVQYEKTFRNILVIQNLIKKDLQSSARHCHNMLATKADKLSNHQSVCLGLQFYSIKKATHTNTFTTCGLAFTFFMLVNL